MAIIVAHAVSNENNEAKIGRQGDQKQQKGYSTEEVGFATWYAKNKQGKTWAAYMEPKSPEIAELAAQMFEAIVANPNIGYAQDDRLAWHTSAKVNGGDVTKAKGDCDCSSVICGIFDLLGISNVSPVNSTKTMIAAFRRSGAFNIYTDPAHLSTDALARRGGVYVRNGHTMMAMENGGGSTSSTVTQQPTQATPATYVTVDDPDGWSNVRSGAGLNYSVLGRATAGTRLPAYAVKNGWYETRWNEKKAYIYSGCVSEDGDA